MLNVESFKGINRVEQKKIEYKYKIKDLKNKLT